MQSALPFAKWLGIRLSMLSAFLLSANRFCFASLFVLCTLLPGNVWGQSADPLQFQFRMLLIKENLAIDQCRLDDLTKYWHPLPYVYCALETPEHQVVLNSWLAMENWMRTPSEECDPHPAARVHSEHQFRIQDDLAFVDFLVDNQWAASAVLENISGQWKLIRKTRKPIPTVAGPYRPD